jgi:fucose 4-O-acetylase-like acetyltransferase
MNPISEPVKKRNLKIDALRFICIISIFLAHSKPENAWVAQLRIFDVVLMVLLLANSFYVSAANKKISYVNYVKKRFNRLVIPTWIFLTIFFAFFFLLGL